MKAQAFKYLSKFFFRAIFISLFFLTPAVEAQQPPFSPVELRVNYAEKSLAIDDPAPRFSWIVQDEDRGEIQTAYEIIVASSKDLIDNSSGDIWSSGRIMSSGQNGVVYQGPSLQGLSKYWWKVRTWDKDHICGAWSDASWFETAMMKESDWGASYLSGSFNLLRKEFSLDGNKTIQKARAYVTGQGWFEFRINGQKVGDHALDPLTTQTGGSKYLHLYVSFDITDLLNAEGANAVGIMLGTGLTYREDVKLALCQIEIWYTDGSRQSIYSDSTWKALKGGPIIHQHVFDGESYDARKEIPGWDLPDFDDTEWQIPAVLSPGIAPGWSISEAILDAKDSNAGLIKDEYGWSDFTFKADFNIISTCVGLVFRATDENNFYMWQINSGTPGTIRPHVKTNGNWKILETENLEIPVQPNSWYNVKIITEGQVIKTYIDGLLVSTIRDSTHTFGRIGIRNALNERALIDNISVSENDQVVFREDFSNGMGQWGSGISSHLRSQIEPIRISEIIIPKSITNPKPGVYVYDMGKNISGWVELNVQGTAGTTVTLKFAERTFPDGMINRSSTVNGLPAEAIDTYTLKGDGIEVWEPRFTYHGFRYVEVTGFPGTPEVNNITGKMFHSDVTCKETSFSCSNPLLTKISEAYKLTQVDNMMGYPTDCNQRGERAGWLADAMVTSESAMLYFDAFRFYEKWIHDLLLDEKPNGASGCLIPGGGGDDVIWGSACVSIPWDFYFMSGDTSFLSKSYERAKRYVSWYLSLDVNKNYILDNSSEGPAIQWNDWNAPGAKPSNDYMGSAYFFHCANIVAKMAQVLENESDYSTYHTLAQNIEEAINQRFLMNGNRYDNGSQAANSIALNFGFVPEKNRDEVSLYLRNSVLRTMQLSTGALGTFSLLPALAQYNSNDAAYIITSRTSYPGWGYMLLADNAPGTFWEHWDNRDLSKNHPFLAGSVASWLVYHVAGIKPAGPGFSNIVLKPGITSLLDSASATVQSVKGNIYSSWKKNDHAFTWEISIPVNTSAMIYIPVDSILSSIKEGDEDIWRDFSPISLEELTFVKKEDNYVVYNIGSGDYSFTVTTKIDTSTINSVNKQIINRRETEDIHVFPNPSSSSIFVEMPEHGVESISLKDMRGNTVLQEDISFISPQKINIVHLKSGIYLLNLLGRNTSKCKVIIKN